MNREGPALEKLLRRLAECPPEFWNSAVDFMPASHGEAATATEHGMRQGVRVGGSRSQQPRELESDASAAIIPVDGSQLTAIACDHFRQLEPGQPVTAISRSLSALSLQQCGVVSIVLWLIADEWFVDRIDLVPQYKQLIVDQRILGMADLVSAERLIADPDRREELVRLTLQALDMRPAGETAAQAADRLNTLDTRERQRVLQATLVAERRAREVREAMLRAKAQESASRYGE